MDTRPIGIVSLAILALSLGGCGGGGGGTAPPPPTSSAPTPTPAPAPAPSPTPSPTPAPTPAPSPQAIEGPVALTQAAEFTTLSWAYRFTTAPDGTFLEGSRDPDPSATVEFRYFAAERVHEVLLPGLQLGRLQTVDASRTDFTIQTLLERASGNQVATLNLLRPGSLNTLFAAEYTSLGDWGAGRQENGRILQNFGDFAYGIPTRASDMPRTGTATFQLFVFGGFGYLVGTGQIAVDFGAGTASGHMETDLNDGIGGIARMARQELTDFRLGPDGTTFTAMFATPGSPSVIEGRFTGPQAVELMARWSVRAPDPHNPGPLRTFYGVWIGRRA